ncbi:major facilitator superfamily domain-containing protein [Chiua virens]|nr:major facilitator superfamily domain-containing protein [Chiua virens]
MMLRMVLISASHWLQNQFYQIVLSQGLGFGIAASMSYVPALAVLSQHFHKRVDLVMSIVASGAPIGSSLYTIMLNNLLNGNLGFANAIRITAAVNAVLMLIGCCLMRTRPHFPTTQIHYFQLLRSASLDYPYLVASVGLFLYAAGSFFPIFYIQLDSAMHRLGTEFAFYTVVILNGGNFVGRATAGFISAYCGPVDAVIVATLFSGVVTIAMIGLSTRASAICVSVFFGYFEGVYVALCAPLITLLTHDVSELGARLGISLFMAGLGSLIGTPLAGVLLGSNYIWWRPSLLCGCFIIASTILFVITRFMLRNKKQTAPGTP